MLLSYLTWFILTKVVSLKVLGVASASFSLLYLLSLLVNLGIHGPILKFVPNQEHRKTVITTSTILVLTTSGVTATLLYLFSHTISHILNVPRTCIVAVALWLVVNAICYLARYIGISLLKCTQVATIDVVVAVCRIVAACTLAVIGLGALGVVLGYLISTVLGTILYTIIIREVLIHLLPQSSRLDFHLVLRYSLPTYLPNVVSASPSLFGVLLVSSYYGGEETGLFYIALAYTQALTFLPTLATTLLVPMSSSSESDGSKSPNYSEVASLSLGLSLVLMVVGLYLARFFLSLLGTTYLRAIPLIQVLLTSIPLAIAMNVAWSSSYIASRPEQVLTYALPSSILQVVLYIVLVPSLGSIGAAYARVVSLSLGAGIAVLVAARLGMEIPWLRMIPSILVAALLYLVYILNPIESMYLELLTSLIVALVMMLLLEKLGIRVLTLVVRLAMVILPRGKIRGQGTNH